MSTTTKPVKFDRVLSFKYFQNPYGPGVSIGNIALMKKALITEYSEFISEKITFKKFHDAKKDVYIISFKLPSKSSYKYEKDIFYDVILQFEPYGEHPDQAITIKEYKMTVFSNCPAFIYTYTNVCKRKNCLIPWIPSRYFNKMALNVASKTKNPHDMIAFDSSLWFTMYTMEINALFKKSNFTEESEPYKNNTQILSDVMSQDEKQKELKDSKKVKEVVSKKKLNDQKKDKKKVDKKIDEKKKSNKKK